MTGGANTILNVSLVSRRQSGAGKETVMRGRVDVPTRSEEALTLDVVCGQVVDAGSTEHRSHHEGRAYYFCCAGCRRSFDADPDRYLKAQAYGPFH